MNTELKKRIITSCVLLFLLTSMYYYTFIMITALVVIGIITWIEFYSLMPKIFKKKSNKNKFYIFLFKLISLLYLSLLVYFLFLTESYYLHLKIFVLYSTLVAILSDIGGLVFGKTFKGKKLTTISPNKTISGSIGSFIFSLILVPIFHDKLTEFNHLILIIITIFVSLISQLGDLFISYLKRKAKVKNTSDILPGHGGFLDRVDGIIFAIPFGILLFNIFI
jgi:phosphatidate cytidylyltransferase